MKAIIMIALFILVSPILLFSGNQQIIEDVKDESSRKAIISVQEEIEQIKVDLKKDNDVQEKLTQTSFNGISAQLVAINTFLTIVAIIITFFGIGISIYITYQAKKITNISKETQDLLNKTNAAKAEVDHLTEMVQSNLSGLYVGIKEEETRHIIKRLKRQPRDIVNFGTILGSRDLSDEYYPDLKACFLSFKESGFEEQTYKNDYILLFFQDFAGLAFFDPQLSDVLKLNYYLYLSHVFENDIINTTKDLVKACIGHDFRSRCVELIPYLAKVKEHKSRGTAVEEVMNVFWEELRTKENRFAFYEMLPDEDFFRDLKAIHAGRLVKDYGATSNSRDENTILTQARSLTADKAEGDPTT